MREFVGELGFNQVALLAKDDNATLKDLKKKNGVSSKVFKIRKALLDEEFLNWVNFGKFMEYLASSICIN